MIRDGILSPRELHTFFDSYRENLSDVQLEMMAMEYDLYRDGGLRFDSLKTWFEHKPIHLKMKETLKSIVQNEQFYVPRPSNANTQRNSNQGLQNNFFFLSFFFVFHLNYVSININVTNDNKIIRDGKTKHCKFRCIKRNGCTLV